MKFADFLTTYPLYKKCSFETPSDFDRSQPHWPAIMMFCPICDSDQTFAGIHREPYPTVSPPQVVENRVVEFVYNCASCKKYYLYFLVKFLDWPTAIKIGQYPPFDISIEKNLKELLGEHEENYKKGLICESQGYGIGAYAYYRRIVESVIDKLLSSIHDLLDEHEKPAYEKALREVQQDTITERKIDLVKDLIPASLRPDGMNPLSILHETLSTGIHSETDEECLGVAGNIREILTYFVEQIGMAEQTRDSTRRFTESMRKLLDKRRQKNIGAG